MSTNREARAADRASVFATASFSYAILILRKKKKRKKEKKRKKKSYFSVLDR